MVHSSMTIDTSTFSKCIQTCTMRIFQSFLVGSEFQKEVKSILLLVDHFKHVLGRRITGRSISKVITNVTTIKVFWDSKTVSCVCNSHRITMWTVFFFVSMFFFHITKRRAVMNSHHLNIFKRKNSVEHVWIHHYVLRRNATVKKKYERIQNAE